jgi:hypothetical protein
MQSRKKNEPEKITCSECKHREFCAAGTGAGRMRSKPKSKCPFLDSPSDQEFNNLDFNPADFRVSHMGLLEQQDFKGLDGWIDYSLIQSKIKLIKVDLWLSWLDKKKKVEKHETAVSDYDLNELQGNVSLYRSKKNQPVIIPDVVREFNINEMFDYASDPSVSDRDALRAQKALSRATSRYKNLDELTFQVPLLSARDTIKIIKNHR